MVFPVKYLYWFPVNVPLHPSSDVGKL
jgi:hypothetical protein